MKKAIALGFIASFAVLAAVPRAHADSISDYVRMELGAGVSHYQTAGDGQWYQQGMPHELNLTAPALMIGATGPIYTGEAWGVDWHIDYINLGHASSDCYCTSVDANYDAKAHRRIYTPPYENLQPAKMVGNGNAQGIALMLEPYIKYRGWRFGVTGGIFPYRPDWTEDVYNTQDNILPNGQPVPAHDITFITPHTVQLGKVIGVTIQRGNFGIAYQHFLLPTRFDATHSPSIWKGADVVMMTYKF